MSRPRTFEINWALDKALEVFWERGGYDRTPMQAIADQLRLSRSAIYFTFGSKQALFAQALRRAAGSRTRRELTQRVPAVAQVVAETLQELKARFRDAVERGQGAAEIDAAVDPVTVARVLLALYLGAQVHVGAGVAPVQRALLQQVETLLPAPGRENRP